MLKYHANIKSKHFSDINFRRVDYTQKNIDRIEIDCKTGYLKLALPKKTRIYGKIS